MAQGESNAAPILYDNPPERDKDGNIIPPTPGTGLGCLIYPVVLLLLLGGAWFAIRHFL
jgi:hypothetical protein